MTKININFGDDGPYAKEDVQKLIETINEDIAENYIDYLEIEDVCDDKPSWCGSPPPEARMWASATFSVVLFLVGMLWGGLTVLVMLP